MICFGCKEPITKMKGRDKDSYAQHHINEDRTDNRKENLQDFHYGCHYRYHLLQPKHQRRMSEFGKKNKGRKRTEEFKKERSEAYMGRPGYAKGYHHTEEHKKWLSENSKKWGFSFKGRKHTEETKAKLRKIALARVT